MKGQTNSKTMTIRLPVEVCEALTKIRDSNNLATVGSALKYWIEQQTNERIDTRLNSIEEQIGKMTKILDILAPSVNQMNKLFNRILNVLFKMNKRTEARLDSLEAKELEKVK